MKDHYTGEPPEQFRPKPKAETVWIFGFMVVSGLLGAYGLMAATAGGDWRWLLLCLPMYGFYRWASRQ